MVSDVMASGLAAVGDRSAVPITKPPAVACMLAVIEVSPGPRAEAIPFALIVATAVLLDAQVT